MKKENLLIAGLIIMIIGFSIGYVGLDLNDRFNVEVKESQEKGVQLVKKKLVSLSNRKLKFEKSSDQAIKNVIPDYKGNDVVPLSYSEMDKANVENIVSDFGSGLISIPSIGLELSILEGVSQSNLSVGAGTMKAGQKVGKGNFALAGHYMDNWHYLFGGLKKVEKNAEVTVNYEGVTGRYKVLSVETINDSMGWVIDDSQGEALLTLITCESSELGTKKRIMVRAAFIE